MTRLHLIWKEVWFWWIGLLLGFILGFLSVLSMMKAFPFERTLHRYWQDF